jgi:phytoene dehydrogenase-like protein
MGWNCMKCAAYPLGGSQRLVEVAAEGYRMLGGRIEVGSRVVRVAVNDGKACGLELADGTSVTADAVVSTIDGLTTLEQLLGGPFASSRLCRTMRGLPLFPPTLQVSLGIAREFAPGPNKVIMPLLRPMTMGTDTGVDTMMVRICSFDPSLAPAGKTAVVVNLRCHDFDYWQNLRKSDRSAYSAAKRKVVEEVIDTLEERFGDIRSRVESSDVATPATYTRYTAIHRGSYQGWAPTPKTVGRSLPRSLPGLANFYMAGQWVEFGGGIPRVVLSARNTVQIICRDDHRRFTVTPLSDGPRGSQTKGNAS